MKYYNTGVIDKSKVLGQFFTREAIVEKLLDVLFTFKPYTKTIKILEPSSGTGNFINVLQKQGFHNIDGCEIDPELTENPQNFLDYPLDKKYDLIIGNPPFSKYNIKDSYCSIDSCFTHKCQPQEYLPESLFKKDKEKIENIFILKSMKHLGDNNSTLAFILPISFFIKNKNRLIKEKISDIFSTIIIFQNKEVWFNYNIPCCFAVFTNIETFNNKIIILYENGKSNKEITDLKNINDELIPEVIFNKKTGVIKNCKGIPLKKYLSPAKIKYKKSYSDNNISARNILGKKIIPSRANVEDFKLAIARVGNGSVGKCGLVNIKYDILNDMFYVFEFDKEYNKTRHLKEKICEFINNNREYFKNITCRVGSKSIKKEDIYNFKVSLH